jgi:hypothetical protein
MAREETTVTLALVTHEELRNVLRAQAAGLLRSGRSDEYVQGGMDALAQIATAYGIDLTPMRTPRAVWHIEQIEDAR